MEKHGLIPKNLIDQQQNKSKYPSVKVRENPCKSVAKNQNEEYKNLDKQEFYAEEKFACHENN